MIEAFRRVLAAALLLLTLAFAPAGLAAPATWIRAESPNFVLYTDVRAETAQEYLTTLERFDQLLRLSHGLKPDAPVRRKLPIYLLRRRGDLDEIWPSVRSSTAGFYTALDDDVYAVAAYDRRDDAFILHEYVHHFMLQHFPYAYPAWMVEGYAEYYMTFKATGDTIEWGNVHQNRRDWLVHGDWLDYRRVLREHPSDLGDGQRIAMFYAQAWALTHYLLSDPGRRKQLDGYLKAVSRGDDPVEAMEAAGLKPATMHREIRRYLERGFPYQRAQLPAAPSMTVRVSPLPASAADTLLLTLRVRRDNGIDAPEDRTDGPVLLADARRAAALHPGDRLSDLLLAAAEIKLGDLKVGESALDRRLKADPEDVEALMLMASARMKQADSAGADAAALRKAARDLIGRAFKADPNRYQVLASYLDARKDMADFPTDNDVNVALEALSLAPQFGNVRVHAAAILAERERWSDAAAALQPLAMNPHGGESLAAIRGLLTLYEAKAADAKAKPGTIAASTASGSDTR